MKRVWFAVVFIILTAIACVTEQMYINNFCNELNRKADVAVYYSINGNDLQYKKSIEGIGTYWKKKNDLMYCLSNHVILDELSYRINSANNIEAAVYEIKAVVNAIYENSRIKLSNIL